MGYSRDKVVNLARSWIGKKESDGSYKTIIDIYNSFPDPLPRGIKMQYEWSWCATTWSALAIKLEYTEIMPIEISCGELIERAKKMGCWAENDGYVPKPGDAILYDWQDTGSGDNTGWPDHIGMVEYVNESSGYFVVIEGNYNDEVKRRTVSINGRYIRGFITPKYNQTSSGVYTDSPSSSSKKTISEIACEVIAGKWGSGEERKKKLKAAGYDYTSVQEQVNLKLNGSAVVSSGSTNQVYQPISKRCHSNCVAKYNDVNLIGAYETTADLYCRNDAGTNKKALCLIPKGTTVRCYGYYNLSGNVRWPFITFVLDGVEYTGFSSSQYLKRP